MTNDERLAELERRAALIGATVTREGREIYITKHQPSGREGLTTAESADLTAGLEFERWPSARMRQLALNQHAAPPIIH